MNHRRGMRHTSQVMGVYRTLSHLPREQRGVWLNFDLAAGPSITGHELVKWASIASLGSSFGLIAVSHQRR